MLKPKMLIGGSVLLVAILGGGWYWYQQLRFIETTDNAYVETDISHLSVKVPGYVVKTDITDNQHVEAGSCWHNWKTVSIRPSCRRSRRHWTVPKPN